MISVPELNAFVADRNRRRWPADNGSNLGVGLAAKGAPEGVAFDRSAGLLGFLTWLRILVSHGI
jgi:hypothetical protein